MPLVAGSIPGPGTWHVICKKLALNIRDCESLCLSQETLKSVGPFYLVSMPGEEKKIPRRGSMCNLSWTPHSNIEKDNSLNHSYVSPKIGFLEYTV